MALLDLLGRRHALRVIWELRQDGALTFRELQTAMDGVSSSVLNDRLAELREAGVVDRTADGYALSAHGRDLLGAFGPLNEWAQRWAQRVS